MIINYCLNVKVCPPTLSLNTLMIIKPMVISLSYYLWFVLSIFILRINGFKFKFCNCRRFKWKFQSASKIYFIFFFPKTVIWTAISVFVQYLIVLYNHYLSLEHPCVVFDKDEMKAFSKWHFLVGVGCLWILTSLHTDILLVKLFQDHLSFEWVLINLLAQHH